jgi:predicted regulator of Ras-like GTPase activity (Roadblock/LC7/MglB family)
MSATPETTLAKILRSSRAIKQILVIDSVGLVIAKVLRTKPIEGIGALEASIFRSTEDIVEFLDLGKSILHLSLYEDYAVMGLDIGIGSLVMVLDYNTRWVLDAELIDSAIRELIDLWVNQLGLEGYDFSGLNRIKKVLTLLYQGDRVPPYNIDEDSFDIIHDLFQGVRNQMIYANCITNELGLPIAYINRPDFNVDGEELGGTLLAVDAIAKEKGENAGLGTPIFSIVFTTQNKGFLTAHAGSMDGVEPLTYLTLFDLEKGFIPILSDVRQMIKNLSQEYGDDLSKRFLDTVNSIFKQMFPEEPIPAEEAVPTQKMDELQNMFGEIEKNIDDSISYYMMMLGEFMELISSRCSEIQNSLQAYDQDLRKWIQDNIPIFKGSPLEEKMDQQMEKWVSAKEVVENKLSKMLER